MKKSFNRKFLLLPILLLATGSAWAEWEKIAANNDATFYVDRATLRKDGNLRRMWSIQNLKQRNKDGEISRRIRYEYDCKGERSRALALSTHTEPMADGKTLFSSSGDLNDPWNDIPPESAGERILKIVCAQ
jgi:hypothetical protein